MTGDKNALFRAVQGPVVLIVVGSLFALDQNTRFSFHQTWPVILIAIGLLNLGRWTTGRPQS